MITTEVTRTQAEAVLAAICKRYATHLDGFSFTTPDGRLVEFPAVPDYDRPQLVENFEFYPGHTVRWAVVWDGGDFEWAYRACGGGLNEEIATTLRHEFGLPRDEVAARATEAPVERGPEVMLEPATSYAVGIYPA